MSLNSIISAILIFIIIFASIIMTTDTPGVFLNIPSIILVLGGTVVALFISYEFKVAMNTLMLIFSSFKKSSCDYSDMKSEVARLVSWAYIIQKAGLQGLENEFNNQLQEEEPFLSYGGELVVTGYTGVEIGQTLNNLIESESAKDTITTDALKKMGGDAPAYGMLGTMIGLIVMLGNMGTNPAAIGPSMAIALITTFYGIICARTIFIPVASKISSRLDVSKYKHILQKEGLILLAERKSPRYIQDRLNSFVDINDQFSIDRDINLSAMAIPTPPTNNSGNE